MGVFKFACGSCGQHLTATPDQIGVTAPCPNCAYPTTVPDLRPAPAVPIDSRPILIPSAGAAKRRYRFAIFKVVVAALPLFLLVGLIVSAAGYLIANKLHYRRRAQERERLEVERSVETPRLQRLVDSLQAQMRTDLPSAPSVPLQPPYVVFYLGSSSHSPYAGERGILRPYRARPMTMIVVRDEILGTEMHHYSGSDGGAWRVDQTYYLHRSQMWAVDLTTEKVVAYKQIDDKESSGGLIAFPSFNGYRPPLTDTPRERHPFKWGETLTGEPDSPVPKVRLW